MGVRVLMVMGVELVMVMVVVVTMMVVVVLRRVVVVVMTVTVAGMVVTVVMVVKVVVVVVVMAVLPCHARPAPGTQLSVARHRQTRPSAALPCHSADSQKRRTRLWLERSSPPIENPAGEHRHLPSYIRRTWLAGRRRCSRTSAPVPVLGSHSCHLRRNNPTWGRQNP
jgi:hypothetical protein